MSVLFSALKKISTTEGLPANAGTLSVHRNDGAEARPFPWLWALVGASVLLLLIGAGYLMHTLSTLDEESVRPEDMAQADPQPTATPATANLPNAAGMASPMAAAIAVPQASVSAPISDLTGATAEETAALLMPALPQEIVGLRSELEAAKKLAQSVLDANGTLLEGQPLDNAGSLGQLTMPPLPTSLPYEDLEAPDPAKAAIISVRYAIAAEESGAMQVGAQKSLEAGDYAAAEKQYVAALRNNPQSISAREGLALALLRQPPRQERTLKAMRLLREARAQSPVPSENLEANLAVALSAAAMSGDKLAERELTVLASNSENPIILDALASLLLHQRALVRAEDVWLRAIRVAPRQPGLRFNLASLYDQQGKTSLAAAYYREALNLEANDPQLPSAAIRERLSWLEKTLQQR